MIACQHYSSPEVQAAILKLSKEDASERVKQAAMEIFEKQKKH